MQPKEFLAKHGFPGTPAGDRMAEDLMDVIAQAFEGGTEGTTHDADNTRGVDKWGGAEFAKCGKRVHLGDMEHWYGGAAYLIDCVDCLRLMDEDELNTKQLRLLKRSKK